MNRLELIATNIQGQSITFRYGFNDGLYETTLEFPVPVDVSRPAAARLIQYAAIVSCYHLFDLAYFDEIVVPFGLHPEETAFFETLYFNGLAEFRFRNKIPLAQGVRIVAEGDIPVSPSIGTIDTPLRPLLLNGGGKDGAVAAEILKGLGVKFAWYTYQPRPSRERIVQTSGVLTSLFTKKLNNPAKKTFNTYRGHKPLSGQLAVYASLCAVLSGQNSVVTANEYSSNFENLVHEGISINHQFTKSFLFEQEFAHLVHRFIDPNLHYFSIVRPFYDVQIIKMFVELPHYFRVFLSCNKSMRKDKWCLACPKCAFVVAGIMAFAPQAAQTIWGEPAPLQRPALFKELITLIDESPKPFDCVGTPEEVAYALLCMQQNGSFKNLSTDQQATLQPYLAHYDSKTLTATLMTLNGRAHQIPAALWAEMQDLPLVHKAVK